VRMSRFVALAGAAVLVACAALLSPASYDEIKKPTAATAREKGDRAVHARAILRKYCHECHGGKESKGTVAVMDHARLVATGPNPVPFVLPGDAAKSQIIQFIEDGSMPPGGKPRPSDDEIKVLKAWIADSATHFPSSFDADATLKLLLDDSAKHPEDRPHVRYLSFAHLIRDGAAPPNLAAAERDLFAALGGCGLAEMPTPVDGAATLYRLDTRQAGWGTRGLFVKESQGAEGVHPLTPYDLLLLEYPHWVSLPTADLFAGRLDEYLAAAKVARPVPLLHADWVAGMLKKDSPLAADLKSLSELDAALKNGVAEAKLPRGPRPQAFGRLNPVPEFAKPESPRAVLPLSSWYSGDCEPSQPPFTLSAELVDLGGKSLKSVNTGEGFNLRVTSDRQAHFVLLMVWSRGQAVLQPTSHNGFLEAKANVLGPPDAARDGFAIADILTGEKEAVEYFVLLASPDPLPKPTIVRSKHSRGVGREKMTSYPVYRFLFESDAKFDPSKVVRRVIPVPVAIAKGD
jgi:hypothetical protein